MNREHAQQNDGDTGAHGTGDAWAGQSLGLPEKGPGSIAPLGRRVLALLIDWALALFLGAMIAQMFYEGDDTIGQIYALGSFAVLHILLVGLLGVTLGKRILRIQVVRGMSAPGIPAAAVRTGLLLLVVPAVVAGADGRTVHDRAAGTAQLRM